MSRRGYSVYQRSPIPHPWTGTGLQPDRHWTVELTRFLERCTPFLPAQGGAYPPTHTCHDHFYFSQNGNRRGRVVCVHARAKVKATAWTHAPKIPVKKSPVQPVCRSKKIKGRCRRPLVLSTIGLPLLCKALHPFSCWPGRHNILQQCWAIF